jgi:hypothetical protein
VFTWVLSIEVASFYGFFNFTRWNAVFLLNPVRNNHEILALGEEEHPILNALMGDPQFPNPISQAVGVRSSKLMAKLLEKIEFRQAFSAHLAIQST